MSARNVEVVRRSLEALARGDLDAFFAEHAPEIEWTTGADEPDPRTYRGPEEMRRFTLDASEAWVNRFDDVVRFKNFIDLGDWVVVPWTATLEGRASGLAVEVYETYAVRVVEGRIVRVDEYRTTEEALKACAQG